MLLVEDPSTPPPKKPLYDENFRLLDAGVTPPTRNIRRRKFRERPRIPRSEVMEAEEELLRIMKNEAFVQKDGTYELLNAIISLSYHHIIAFSFCFS
jgi:hypothetical protein